MVQEIKHADPRGALHLAMKRKGLEVSHDIRDHDSRQEYWEIVDFGLYGLRTWIPRKPLFGIFPLRDQCLPVATIISAPWAEDLNSRAYRVQQIEEGDLTFGYIRPEYKNQVLQALSEFEKETGLPARVISA